MPRIIATTTVRNECDIVESYCRYTLTFCDKLVINDNSSKDNTADIIKQLVDEGLPIVLLNNIPYNLGTKYFINNQLLRIAMEEHHADIVLPIDVDEFLITASGENPRAVIEALDPLIEHQIPWRTFIRTSYTENNEEFLPDGFAKRRADEVQQFYKTIVSSQMFSENGCTLTAGSHDINYPDGANRRPIQVTSGLFYAHYPIRNSYQAVQKTALSLYSHLIHKGDDRNCGFQYYDNYEKLIQSGWFSNADVVDLAKYYAIEQDNQNQIINLIEDQQDPYAHARPLKLKYTDYGANQRLLMVTLLSQIEEMLTKILDDKKQQSQAIKDKDASIATYQNTIDEIMTSNSWKLTKPLRAIGGMRKKTETE